MQRRHAPDNPPTTILVTGATGFIGGRLAAAAMARGLRVRSLSRSEWPGPPYVPAAERYLGSLPFCVPDRCLAGVDAVVHCAALTGPGGPGEARAINVEGTVLLAERARDLGVSRFLFLSSQSASARAPSAYGRTKYDAELALGRLAGIETVVVRPGLVYGPGSRGLYRRLRRTVARLPILPLLDGGRAPVQPIHVDDLCRGLLRALELPLDGPPPLLLGDPEGMRLADFLQAIALADCGRRKPILPLPLAPIAALVGALESLGVPLPVTTDNLAGLRAVELMDTRADLERLGVELRPLAEGLREERQPVEPGPPLDNRPAGIVLVGAGRIGTLHALTAARTRGARLAAVVDRSRTALARLAGLGLRTRFTTSLDEALAGEGVDAVIVATPASSHLSLVRRSLAAGRAVLVEKPLAVRAEQLAEYDRLAAEPAARRVQVGYLAPRYPQVEHALERLRAGAYGEVRRFLGLTLLTLIRETDSRRWEVQPELSGGGVLINSGGHVLSLVRAAFGDPLEVAARSLRPWSARVEDSLVADLVYAGFGGRCLASWSIDGYPRQENRLVVWTDRGVLTLTNNTAVFEPVEGALELAHQLDFDVGFNLMPDYAGGGIAAEHRDLQRIVRQGSPPGLGLEAAVAVERLIFRLYEAARTDLPLEEARGEEPAEPSTGAPLPAATSSPRASTPASRTPPWSWISGR